MTRIRSWKSTEFKSLQKDWYKALADEGFVDAEELIGEELVLRQTAAHPYQGLPEVVRQSKEDYFRLLAQHTQKEVFKRSVDRWILALRSQGHQIKTICAYLIVMDMARERKTVRFIIRKYEMKWGIREYTPKQLNYLKIPV